MHHFIGNQPFVRVTLVGPKGTREVDALLDSGAVQSLFDIELAKGLGLDPAKTNVNGGAIALGHPIGCSGAAIATKAIHELHRVQGKYALVTMCIGGGQGIATIFERL